MVCTEHEDKYYFCHNCSENGECPKCEEEDDSEESDDEFDYDEKENIPPMDFKQVQQLE
jgi:hypothetical protein